MQGQVCARQRPLKLDLRIHRRNGRRSARTGGDLVSTDRWTVRSGLHFRVERVRVETPRRGLGPGPERGGSSSLPARTTAVGRLEVKRTLRLPNVLPASFSNRSAVLPSSPSTAHRSATRESGGTACAKCAVLAARRDERVNVRCVVLFTEAAQLQIACEDEPCSRTAPSRTPRAHVVRRSCSLQAR